MGKIKNINTPNLLGIERGSVRGTVAPLSVRPPRKAYKLPKANMTQKTQKDNKKMEEKRNFFFHFRSE
jgi:hypothetical protein